MSVHNVARRSFLALAAGMTGTMLFAEEGLREPVFRVANAPEKTPTTAPAHPLDPAISFAEEGLARLRREVKDYTCTIIKRERIKGELNDYEYMSAKIRNRQVEDGKVKVPFSVYLSFVKPATVAGREVIYVEGANNGKLLAHDGPNNPLMQRFGTVPLEPTGHIAMRGQLYPITDIGLETLVAKLIEKGKHDRQYGEVEAEFIKGAKINGRQCTLLQVKHPTMRDHFEFHLAQIFIDDELQLPVRYVAYHWPAAAGAAPPVMEEYTYVNIKTNVGLTDQDFSRDNPAYKF